jgi:mRNA interferase RelE/StbE
MKSSRIAGLPVNYKVVFSSSAHKQIKKLDAFQRQVILSWVKKNLDGTDNPRKHGKALTENLSNLWRYRVGDYRIIAEIIEKEVVISVIKIGHRSRVYS